MDFSNPPAEKGGLPGACSRGTKAQLMLGIGDYAVGSEPMTSIGLGSCVALIVHDPVLKIGGMAHVMLPESNGRKECRGKYADTAVELLVSSLRERSGRENGLVAKIAGGACMFSSFTGRINIGERNVESLKAHLKRYGVRLVAEDTGGSCGRSVSYIPGEGGRVIVRRADGSYLTL